MSSLIKDYGVERGQTFVVLTNGTKYRYDDNAEIYKNLVLAEDNGESLGRTFNRLKGNYSYERVS